MDERLMKRLVKEMESIEAAKSPILRKLYGGEVFPEDSKFGGDPDYRILARKLSLISRMMQSPPAEPADAARLWEKYVDAQNEMNAFLERERFVEGFILAVRFIVEALK